MKKIIFPIFLLALLSACGQQEQEQTPKKPNPLDIVNNPRTADGTGDLSQLGTLSFKDSVKDFGVIKAGEKVSYDFEYTNTGKSDILISEARTSCGCTASDYKKEAIKPGEQGKISVSFNSEGKKGAQHKMIVIVSNGNPALQNLTITADVKE